MTEDKQSFTPASEGTANPPLPEPESALPAQAPEQDLESFEETESFADDDASARPSLCLL